MPKQSSKLQTNLELFATRAIIGAIGLFPLKTSMSIGKTAGRMIGSLIPKLKKTAFRNIEIALPELSEAERRGLVSGTFASLGRQMGLIAHFREFTHEDVRELVDIHGREHFDAAHATGRGILFFTGHFGSWEVFSLLPPAFGYAMNILVRRIDNTFVEEYVDSLRTRFGAVTLDKTKSARKMFRLLENGEMLGILADLNAQEREGVFVDFFGLPASTTTSIAKLALATNAIVLPAFAVWHEERGKYAVYLESPVEYAKTGDHERDIHALTQKITTIVEDYVRRYPEQWLWIHKRWNTRPPGEKAIY
jgi:KDO2-lipid IV(A) lauroyltransferase